MNYITQKGFAFNNKCTRWLNTQSPTTLLILKKGRKLILYVYKASLGYEMLLFVF